MAARSRWLVGSSSTSRLAPRAISSARSARVRSPGDRVPDRRAARRRRRGRTSPAGSAPRPRPDRSPRGTRRPACSPASKVRRTWSTSPTTTDAAEPGPAGRQRQPAEQGAEQRRLARAVGTGQRDPVAAVHAPGRPDPAGSRRARRRRPASPATSSGPRVAGSSDSRSCHGSRGSSTSSSRSSSRSVRAAAAPRALRAGHVGGPDELVRLGRPGPGAGRAGGALAGPLLVTAGPVDEGRALVVVRLEGRSGRRPRALALLEVGGEAAAEDRALAG